MLSEWFNQQKQNLGLYYEVLKVLIAEFKEKIRPKKDRLIQVIQAASTAINTFRLTIQITPYVLSIITVFTTLPLFGFVLPKVLYDARLIIPILTLIALAHGYYTDRSLTKRQQLDTKTEKHEADIVQLNARVEALEKLLEKSNGLRFSSSPNASPSPSLQSSHNAIVELSLK